MLSEGLKHRISRRGAVGAGLAIVSGTLLAVWYLSGAVHMSDRGKAESPAGATLPQGPPWIYPPRADARYRIAVYADLECPYCKAYLPALMVWVDRHPQTALHWRHLPLAFHEPAATELAVMAECAGTLGGHGAFWAGVTWIFRHTRGDGRGLSGETSLPGMTPALRECLDGNAAKAAVLEQTRQAADEGIDATPTLKLSDMQTGKELILSGAIEGDALLSALDMISVEDEPPLAADLPADVFGMPR